MVADLLEYLQQWLKDNPGESVRIFADDTNLEHYKNSGVCIVVNNLTRKGSLHFIRGETLVEALKCMKDTQG